MIQLLPIYVAGTKPKKPTTIVGVTYFDGSERQIASAVLLAIFKLEYAPVDDVQESWLFGR